MSFSPQPVHLIKNSANGSALLDLVECQARFTNPILSLCNCAGRILWFCFTPKVFEIEQHKLSITAGQESAATCEHFLGRRANTRGNATLPSQKVHKVGFKATTSCLLPG